MGLKEAAVGADGLALWHARTVPELSDAVRYLGGRVNTLEGAEPVPPDLSGYVPLADFQALQAQVVALEARVVTLEGTTATLDTDLDATNTDLDALEARVVALEAPAP